MEVECKAEKSQEEREQSVLPSQALWSQPWRGPVMAFSYQVPVSTRPIDKSDPALQGVNVDMGALTGRPHKNHKTAMDRGLSSHRVKLSSLAS